MKPDVACPDEAALYKWLGKELGPEAASHLDAHVPGCMHCQSRIAEPDATLSATVDPGPTRASGAADRDVARGASIGRYIVVEEVGKGGMGVVYAAYDPELNRRVALKILRRRGPDASLRMTREAQAMARLSHPNVLPIHDVGQFDDRVFLALELVDGQSLKQWSQMQKRSWREVLSKYLDAGRGLAAAHAAGLVHRDFKPDNVLVGNDGRVRVTDFGIARQVTDVEGSMPSIMSGETVSGSHSGSLTRVGQVLGTVGYIAPELWEGRVADARSDQFSFCSALYFSLYGAAPFAPPEKRGTRPDFLLRTPAPGHGVPGWVHKIVARGLSMDPEQRYPSMDELLSKLGKDVSKRRAQLAFASLGLVLMASAGVAVVRSSREKVLVCKGAERKLQGTWDASVKQALAVKFKATGSPIADFVTQTVNQALDRYSADWTAMHTEACEATRLRGEQSDEALSLRMMCLDARLTELQSLKDVLLRADAKIVSQAPRAALSLEPLAKCADLAKLRTPGKSQRTPEALAQIKTMGPMVGEFKALATSAQYAAGIELGKKLLAQTQAIPDKSLEAELSNVQGLMLERNNDQPGAHEAYLAAVRAGIESGEDASAALGAAHLVRNSAVTGKFEVAPVWASLSRSHLARAGGDKVAESFLEMAEGTVAFRTGKAEAALVSFQKALGLRVQTLGAEHPDVAGVHNNISAALHWMGRKADALVEVKKANELWSKSLGPDHPETIRSVLNQASMANSAGRYQEALELDKRALAALESSVGPDDESVSRVISQLVQIYNALDMPEERRKAAERNLALHTKRYGAEAFYSAPAQAAMANVLASEGRHKEAVERYRIALNANTKELPPSSPDRAGPHFELADALMAAGRAREALPLAKKAHDLVLNSTKENALNVPAAFASYSSALRLTGDARGALRTAERGLELTESLLGNFSYESATLVEALAEAELALKQPRQAAEHFERALALRSTSDGYLSSKAALRFRWAKALWRARSSQTALAEAKTAASVFRSARREAMAEEVEAWISSKLPKERQAMNTQ